MVLLPAAACCSLCKQLIYTILWCLIRSHFSLDGYFVSSIRLNRFISNISYQSSNLHLFSSVLRYTVLTDVMLYCTHSCSLVYIFSGLFRKSVRIALFPSRHCCQLVTCHTKYSWIFWFSGKFVNWIRFNRFKCLFVVSVNRIQRC